MGYYVPGSSSRIFARGITNLYEWGLNSDNGLPTPYVTDAYGNGMRAKNVDRLFTNPGTRDIFMPNNTWQERTAAFRYAAGGTGMTTVDGYEWNPDNGGNYNLRYQGPQGSTTYFWSNTAAYPLDSGFCWNGYPRIITWGTPPACPAGFEDVGVRQEVVVSYNDWGRGDIEAGGGALTVSNLQTRHDSVSWQFYQYFTWGCGVPGYPYFGASVRYCRKTTFFYPYR